MRYYGWCPHRKDLEDHQACFPCQENSRKTRELIKKKHGKDCTCYVCDPDDYWHHLGKQ